MFMPAVVKVYCEAKAHPTIRLIIELAFTRFCALHQESFIFQTWDVMSNVVALPGVDIPEICRERTAARALCSAVDPGAPRPLANSTTDACK